MEDFRKGKDEFFATSHESPLAHSKTHSIKTLSYFPPDPKFKVHTTLHKYDNPERVSMTTSKGTRQQFHRLGYFEFDIEGKKVKLQAYKVHGAGKQRAFHSLQGQDFRKRKLRRCEILRV